MKYDIGTILVCINPRESVNVFRLKITDHKKEIYKFEPLEYSGDRVCSFLENYIDNYFIIDKEYLWNKEIKEIIDEI